MMVTEVDMSKFVKQALYWTPRVAGILFALFLSMFALDVFEMNLGFWETIVGMIMHLIPAILLAIAILLAWRWEWIGAVIFCGWSVFYMASARGLPWSVYAIIAGIPLVIGILFLVNWIYRREIRAA